MKISTVVFWGLLLTTCHSFILHAGDWPMARHDARRSNITAESLSFPLSPVWVYRPAQPPNPAWPPPKKNLNRTDFDYAPIPVVAEDVVCFGSSADDTVRALDLQTGKEKWHVTTGGPIRFAPQIVGKRVYFGSDDGLVYCVNVETGKKYWVFDPVPQAEEIIGNGRMISRWPIRTGVLVDRNVLYFVAGMWPSEGIYVYALDAETGKVKWLNDTSGAIYARIVGHHPQKSLSGINPQGALLFSADKLIVPNGRAAPAVFDRKTGKLLNWAPGKANGCGGCWLTVEKQNVYLYSKNFYSALGISRLFLDTLERDPKFRVSTPEVSRFIRQWQYSEYEGKVCFLVKDGKTTARKCWGLARAGSDLLVGQDGFIIAQRNGKEIWRADITGKAREFAVANGRLLVASDTGEIRCFAANFSEKTVFIDRQKQEKGKKETAPEPAQKLVAELKKQGLTRGYALLIGDRDGRWARFLANQTELKVVSALFERSQVHALREQLLDDSALYGSQIQVQQIAPDQVLPFPRYFANLVIMVNGSYGLPRELYRVLRPLGGILALPALPDAQCRSLLADCGAPAGEMKKLGAYSVVMRGKLKGAWDGSGAVKGDQLVHWPLRPIWFGLPGPAMVHNRKYRSPTLAAADGRFYVNGDALIIAVDAYNGTILWTRPIPKAPRGNGGLLRAAGDKLYYTLSASYFDQRSLGVFVLDATTGRQQAVYVEPPPIRMRSLASPLVVPLVPPTGKKGPTTEITVSQSADGLTLGLTAPKALPDDQDFYWDLMFDFRPYATRFGLYNSRVRHWRIFPQNKKNGGLVMQADSGEITPKWTASGTERKWKLRLPWRTLSPSGKRPESFGFGAIFGIRDKKTNLYQPQSFFACSAAAPWLNNGWCNLFIGKMPEKILPPDCIVGIPGKRRKRGELPVPGELPWEDYQLARERLDDSRAKQPRIHPLTGLKVKKYWIAGDGCSGTSVSACSVLNRSGNAGFYDFNDDSGMRTFGGVRPSCGVSTWAANGVWFLSDGTSGCECTYPLHGSLALATADRRLNEDWALFSEYRADNVVHLAYLNFGAPGDRRDAAGNLWLGTAKPELPKSRALGIGGKNWVGVLGVWQQPLSVGLPLPLTVQVEKGFGPYRVNADRVSITGTTRPWLYTSEIRGIRKATIKLTFSQPLLSRLIKSSIQLDGKLNDVAWKMPADVQLPITHSTVRLAHDSDNLYLGAFRPSPPPDRKGNPYKWGMRVKQDDDRNYGFGDYWEVFLSDRDNKQVLHFVLTAGGRRYDALAQGEKNEDSRWNGDWRGAVQADETGFCAEFAIPWGLLKKVGLNRDQLQINIMTGRHPKVAEAIVRPGYLGARCCLGFVPLGIGRRPSRPLRDYTVVLHFAELDDVIAGERVFNVQLQGKNVLKNFDIVRESGGIRRAIQRTFKHVKAEKSITLEFSSGTEKKGENSTVPILNAIEIYDTQTSSKR